MRFVKRCRVGRLVPRSVTLLYLLRRLKGERIFMTPITAVVLSLLNGTLLLGDTRRWNGGRRDVWRRVGLWWGGVGWTVCHFARREDLRREGLEGGLRRKVGGREGYRWTVRYFVLATLVWGRTRVFDVVSPVVLLESYRLLQTV